MLNMSDIEREIKKLECGQINYPVCEKLSVLYTIYDHNHKAEQEETPVLYSSAPEPSSEFLRKVNGAPIDQVLQIIDRHLDCVHVLYPKEYSAIMQQIDDLL